MAANKVIRSTEAPGGLLCVDVFERTDGSFGFELYRREPQDGRGWYPVGHFAGLVFANVTSAEQAAVSAVPWMAVT